MQVLVGSVRDEDPIPVVRNHANGILDSIDLILAAAEGGMETPTTFQTDFTKHVEASYNKLSQLKIQLEQAVEASAQHDGKPSAKEFTQRLPPLAFQTAREAKDLVAKADAVVIRSHTDGEDFS